MAGTRLTLCITYITQVCTILFLAIWFSVKESQTLRTKWNPNHQPFLPIRRGMALIESEQVSSSLAGIRNAVEERRLIMNVNFDVIFMTSVVDDYDDEFEGKVVKALASHDSDSSPIHPRFRSSSRVSNDDLATNCDTVDLQDFRDGLIAQGLGTVSDGNSYPLYVVLGCEESVLDVEENGSMLLRLEESLTDYDILEMMRDEVSPSIRTMMHSNKHTNPSPPSISSIVISLVDSNPPSHASGQATTTIQHNEQLTKVFTECLEESLVPMVANELSQLSNVTIQTQYLPFYGQDLTSDTYLSHNEYKDGSTDYTLSASEAKELLLKGDLSHVSQGFMSPNIVVAEERSDIDSGSVQVDIVQLIAFVPGREVSPIFIESGRAWSKAFAIPGRNLAFSVINLLSEVKSSESQSAHERESEGKGDSEHENESESENKNESENENEDGNGSDNRIENDTEDKNEVDDNASSSVELGVEESIRLEVRLAMSYFGSFLRQHYDLPTRQPESMNSGTNHENGDEEHLKHQLRINHARAQNGIAQWELDRVMRNAVVGRVEEILVSMERVIELIRLRSSISVSITSAERIISCIDALKQVLHLSLSDEATIQDVTSMLNQASTLVSKVTSDDETFELPFLAYDQLFAIFGSLILPLFVPLLKNSRAELKRFKEKRLKKKKEKAS